MIDVVICVGVAFLAMMFGVHLIAEGAHQPFEPFPVDDGIAYIERIATPSPTEDRRGNQPETAEPDGRK